MRTGMVNTVRSYQFLRRLFEMSGSISDELRKIKHIEQATIIVMAITVVLSIIHGNLYDYVFDLFSIPNVNFNFRILYLSLFLYSALGSLIFAALYIYDEQTPKVRWYMYVQGWLFLLIAAAAYEWLDSALDKAASIVVNHMLVVENPYTWVNKRYSIILFGAIFLFWLLEARKKKVQK
jgi:hypothetical protein